MITALYHQLLDAARALEPELILMRRHLHQHPELGWNEEKTASFLRDSLSVHNINQSKSVAKTGFFAEIQGDSTSVCSAYRADMDALPIQDEKSVPYASTVANCAHMCGHDVHSTIAYGIARLLEAHKAQLKGKVRIFWQPAEELAESGAPKMIEDGVLDGVDAVFGIHVDPTSPAGVIRLKAGADTAAVDTFHFHIKTKESLHSARPHTGTDSVWLANQMMSFLYQLPTRFTDARDALVISICTLQAGDAVNVIPKEVKFAGTLRSTSKTARERIFKLIQSQVDHFQVQYECEINLNVELGAPAVMNDAKLVDWAKPLLSLMMGDDKVLPAQQSMGAEDFAFYTEKVKALFLRVGSQSGQETAYPLHSSKFDIDERIIAPTCASLAYLLIKYNSLQPT